MSHRHPTNCHPQASASRLVTLVGLGLLLAACSVGPTGVPSPVASPEVVCDKLATPAEGAFASQPNPTPSLTCGTALAAALAALAPAHPAIVREEFRWGGLCPPDAPCVPPLGDQGIVIFDFGSGPPVFVYVSSAPGGVVAPGSPAPYPSGY